ncbi:Oidioi.mRNA.OKI2018_I69.XSR.g15675.t1.cds [Oikopleura dioica]|uniref:Oidioi.mRNA.OKI2018_I69.XSR.g15675.t1.cds n=1 Tax=Oikopleura dioica TaxID=34765 RepID=A0ABN7SMU8_OIKDI|nr:Oidioi.mRNA.OKI2018_I69.XSR.g15675.t1.cds [Oikopleura dioica]
MAQPHWKSHNVRANGVDDLTLLQGSKFNEGGIVENLKKRYDADNIFTYIGPVLISVNPFKQLPYFTQREIELYQGAASFENPPHVYALADTMYRNLTIDNESQSVIISGESGAGKTVAAKFVMNYISNVSGGGTNIQKVKEVIIKSNPLLEAFGNAKTLRNNNSSRFGKYFQISFNGGTPVGGRIQEFLLEKSRVVRPGPGERNFHIFYQLIKGETSPEQRQSLGLSNFQAEDFEYLACSGEYDADEMNDQQEYRETLEAMRTIGMKEDEIEEVLAVVSAILHMGNINFDENDREVAHVRDTRHLEFPAYLLGFQASDLEQKLLTHRMESKWGKQSEIIHQEHSRVKAYATRDSLVKAIYEKLFIYLIRKVNEAIPNSTQLNLGVLDIYGFEIFPKNGFEQFCINYVNEKLQQAFIELTLKAEQEEYNMEGIQWTPIKFFNNIDVCNLIEAKNPPGIISICDDVTKQVGNKESGVAETLVGKLRGGVTQHRHYIEQGAARFKISHYAGEVAYDADGFVEKNRDTVFIDLLEMCKSSTNGFIQELFSGLDLKKKQPTAGSKIRSQANKLIDELMKTQPHYIRTIKPNETKRPHDWNEKKVSHQVKYLGLMENVRVRRAGFAYRRVFNKFLQRYSILTVETFREWRYGTGRDDPRRAIQYIMQSVNMDPQEWQCGQTKVFIKSPESLFLLEEIRERKYNVHARRKQRNRNSISRQFIGDYLGLDHDDQADISKLYGRKERVLFASQAMKYNRKFQSATRDLVVTEKYMYIISRRRVDDGKNPNVPPILEPYVEDQIDMITDLQGATLSPFQDGFILIRIASRDKPIMLDVTLKTEMCWAINKTLRNKANKNLHINFEDKWIVKVEPKGYLQTKGWKKVADRQVFFNQEHCPKVVHVHKEPKKYTMRVSVRQGESPNSMPQTKGATIGGHHHQQRPNYGGSSGIHVQPHSQRNQSYAQQTIPLSVQQPRAQQWNNPGTGARRLSARDNNAPRPMRDATIKERHNQHNHMHQLNEAMAFLQQLGNQTPNLPDQVNALQIEPKRAPPARPKPRVAAKPKTYPKARVIYDYNAQDIDELTLREQDVVDVISEDPSGWWRVSFQGKSGLFPGSYVEKI